MITFGTMFIYVMITILLIFIWARLRKVKIKHRIFDKLIVRISHLYRKMKRKRARKKILRRKKDEKPPGK